MSIEDYFLVFVIGSLIGFMAETIFCYVGKGRLESRRGMLYGPFSQMYGLGALLMLLLLGPLAEGPGLMLFLGSALLGGLFELLCSLFQELVFGSRSWDYSAQRGSLFSGRTALRYMFYWGLLGYGYIRFLHPAIFGLLSRVPQQGKLLFACLLFVLLSINLVLSCFALHRWQERELGREGGGFLSNYLDRSFPSERMARIYPDMKFKKADAA